MRSSYKIKEKRSLIKLEKKTMLNKAQFFSRKSRDKKNIV